MGEPGQVREYRIPVSTEVIGLAGLACWCLFILGAAYAHVGRGSLIFMALLLAWLAYSTVLRVPFRVTISDDHFAEFRSLLGRKVLLPGEVTSVDDAGWASSYIYLKYGRKQITLYRNTKEILGLLSDLQELNPDAEFKGRLARKALGGNGEPSRGIK